MTFQRWAEDQTLCTLFSFFFNIPLYARVGNLQLFARIHKSWTVFICNVVLGLNVECRSMSSDDGAYKLTHTHTHTHTPKHMQLYTRIRTYTHTHTQTYASTHTHTHIPTCTHTHTIPHAYAHIHLDPHKHALSYVFSSHPLIYILTSIRWRTLVMDCRRYLFGRIFHDNMRKCHPSSMHQELNKQRDAGVRLSGSFKFVSGGDIPWIGHFSFLPHISSIYLAYRDLAALK